MADKVRIGLIGFGHMGNQHATALLAGKVDNAVLTAIADIDPAKIHNELGWLPETKFADGIKKTIKWYLDNEAWWEPIVSGEYQNYYEKMYANR